MGDSALRVASPLGRYKAFEWVLDGVHVKKRRRVEVRIEHHELSIYSGPAVMHPASGPEFTADAAASANSTLAEGAGSQLPASLDAASAPQESCVICGSANLLRLADALALAAMSSTALKDGLESGRFHLHCSASGQWWVCGQSIHSSHPSSSYPSSGASHGR